MSITNMLLLTVFLVYAVANTHEFLAAPFGSTYVAPRNLSCFDVVSLVNRIYGAQYCVFFTGLGAPPANYSLTFRGVIFDDWAPVLGNSGSLSMLGWYGDNTRYYGWIRMSRTRCTGFSSAITDVGYSNCTPLPYEMYMPGTLPTLCICATDGCNANLSTCQASVASYAPSPRLTPFLSSFTSPVSCQNQALSTIPGNLTHERCLYLNAYFPMVNTTLCDAYFANNTVMCSFSELGVIDSYTYEEFDAPLRYWWIYTQYSVVTNPNVRFMYYESSTQLLFFMANPSGQPVSGRLCYCTTNNCNVNLSTCAAGLNYNQTTTIGTTSVSNQTTTVGTTSTSNQIITIRTTRASSQTQSSIGSTFYRSHQLFFSMMTTTISYIIRFVNF